VQIELGGIQAAVADLYRCPISRHLMFRFDESEGGRPFIGGLVQHQDELDAPVPLATAFLLGPGILITSTILSHHAAVIRCHSRCSV
jgi:hypothetical protein